jgi:hypothetical protein
MGNSDRRAKSGVRRHAPTRKTMLADGQDDMRPTQSAACAGMIGGMRSAENGAR